jgi:DNA-binding XRE family transcriptional regulator
MGRSWPITEAVPTRPNQNNPERVAQWERSRKSVGANIRRLRIEIGMTQEALALRSGVTRNVLIDVEFGRRGLLYERLFDIAEALQVPVSVLMEPSKRNRRSRSG